MKRKLLSIVLFLALAFNNVLAQVNLQTGAAQYSYPLINYSDPSNNLALNIAIQYTSGNGVKVNEVASNVGLGWSFTGIGFIQRAQIGEADDQNSTELFPVSDICTNSGSFNSNNSFRFWGSANYNYVDNYFPNGFLYTEYPVTNGITSCAIPNEITTIPRFPRVTYTDSKWKRSRRALADRMQDAFIFGFNGRSGTFYIGKDGSILTTEDSKLKISFVQQSMLNQNIRTRISSFKITDETGIEYIFSAFELSEQIQRKAIAPTNTTSVAWVVNPQNVVNLRVLNGDPKGKFTVQKWLLTEISNPRSNQKVLINYSDVNYDYVAGINISGAHKTTNVIGSVTINEERTILKSKQVSSVILPDGHKIDFLYQAQTRVDEGGQQTNPLSQINFLYNNSLINSWKMEYKYFYKTELKSLSDGALMTENDKRFLRMCLVSIQKCGKDNSTCFPKTEFEYYRGEGVSTYETVPPVRCLAQDFWGYYTSPLWEQLYTQKYPDVGYIVHYLNNYLDARAPNSRFAVLGILKKVKTEIGGSVEFSYEQNRASNGITSLDNLPGCVGGVRVSKITVSDGELIPKNTITEFKYEKTDGSSSGWGHENIVTSSTKTLVVYSGPDDYVYEGVEEIDYSGGPRFERAPNQSSRENQIAYLIITAFTNPAAFVAAIIDQFLQIIFSLFPPAPQTRTVTTINFYPYSQMNPIGFQYSRVIQKNIVNGVSTGNIVTEFTDPTYFNTTIPAISYPIEPKMRYAPWKYGLLTKRSIYNTAPQPALVSEEVYSYNNSLLEQEYINANYRSIKIEPEIVRSVTFNDVSDYGSTGITQKSFYPIRGRVELTQKKVRSYGSNGITNETIADYTYDPSNYQLKEMITKNSSGESVGTKIYYPGNYTGISGTALEIMRTQNIINIPITTVSWKMDYASAPKKLMQASVTEFGQISNYDIKPVNIYSSELSEPTVSTITDDAAIQNNLTNFSFLKLNNTIIYDATGNPIETKTEGNRYSSVIYNYSGRLPVAKISNAKSAEISYTSFEAEGTGNWMFPNTSVTNQQSGITGSFAFNLVSTNTVTSNFYLTANSKYKLSFWVKGSKPVFTAQPPYQTTATITDNLVIKKSVSGWDFYEGEVSTNIVARIILTANGTSSNFIDELRLYPASALMVTITYAPGIGKTSECDANNRIVYYQYDELNRLIAVRNENWDIIKAYEYKNKQ